jgi:hypothetical protein
MGDAEKGCCEKAFTAVYVKLSLLRERVADAFTTKGSAWDLDGDGDVEVDELASLMFDHYKNGPALWQMARHPFPKSGRLQPEHFLEATGECFILMCSVGWILTAIFNPGIMTDNELKRRVGYNNICVGFDSPPARYAAMPLQVLQAYLAVRYVSLDSTRALLEKKAGRISKANYRMSRMMNLFWGAFMICFPTLLVITPDVSVNIHTYLFFGMVVFSYCVMLANFVEATNVSFGSKVWMALFTFHSIVLPLVGVIDFTTYQGDDAYDLALKNGVEPAGPMVPWPFLWYLDWGWFALLGTAVVFLPEAPALKVTYELAASRDPEEAAMM